MNPSSPFSLGLTLFWDMVTWYLWVKYLLTLTTKVDTEFIISFWWIQTPWWHRHQESACSGDLGLIPGLGRTPEERNAIHSSILAWRIPWTEEPGGLQYMGSQRVRHDWATKKKNWWVQQMIYKIQPAQFRFCWVKILSFAGLMKNDHPVETKGVS